MYMYSLEGRVRTCNYLQQRLEHYSVHACSSTIESPHVAHTYVSFCGLPLAECTCTIFFQFTLSSKDLNLTEFRLDFYRIVSSHEHYVTLNLPLGPILYPMGSGSTTSSPSGDP